MRTAFVLPLALLCAAQLAACSPSMKSYADPAYRSGATQTLRALSPPLPVRIDVSFQQEGKPKKSSDLRLRALVEKTLNETKVLTPDQMSTSLLSVVVDNIGDKSEAYSTGIKTGLSLGFSGGVVTDQYNFVIGYTPASGQKEELRFHHAMHTAVGGVDLPPGVGSATPNDTFAQIVDDAVRTALLQLQTDRKLTR